jgi:recombination protein RecR
MKGSNMAYYPEPIAKLIESYAKLPGIGQKTATRLAFYTIGMSDDDVNQFAANLLSAKRDLHFCSICGNLTDADPCNICSDESRDRTTIFVVEESKDVLAMEKIREYNGLYHVLHGTISPMNGVSPDDINVKTLITRLIDSQVAEVIIATNATSDGEATAMYLARIIKPAGIKVTRLARGLAVGSDIEYTDEVTLSKAVENRQEI